MREDRTRATRNVAEFIQVQVELAVELAIQAEAAIARAREAVARSQQARAKIAARRSVSGPTRRPDSSQ